MSVLQVPGARLYYETHGGGPLLVMISGATGVAESFRPVTNHLIEHYTVALYDRRGFSRSHLDGPQDYQHRLETDADDVRRLIEHLSDEPATVFGASSGAVVGLEVLTRHPSVVRTLVAFEPCAVRQLPDGQRWLDLFAEIYDLYQRSGIEPAQERFREQAFAESDHVHMARAPRNQANATYWFEHELRQYPAVTLDLDALTAHANRIVAVVGRESRGYPCYEVNAELGRKLGRDVIEVPGGHIGFLTQPAEFATGLVRALSGIERSRHCGRSIHTAARAITTIRDAALNKAGIAFTQWQVLDKAPGHHRDDLVHRLLGLGVDDESGIATALDELHQRGLLDTDHVGNLKLTAKGKVLSQQVSATRTNLHDHLYDGIPAPDLATTMRVLALVTDRARAMHAHHG